MPQYSFFRFEENVHPNWKGGNVERWVFKFKCLNTIFISEEDMIEEIRIRIEEDEEEEGLWQVVEHHKKSLNLWHGPWEVYEEDD